MLMISWPAGLKLFELWWPEQLSVFSVLHSEYNAVFAAVLNGCLIWKKRRFVLKGLVSIIHSDHTQQQRAQTASLFLQRPAKPVQLFAPWGSFTENSIVETWASGRKCLQNGWSGLFFFFFAHPHMVNSHPLVWQRYSGLQQWFTYLALLCMKRACIWSTCWYSQGHVSDAELGCYGEGCVSLRLEAWKLSFSTSSGSTGWVGNGAIYRKSHNLLLCVKIFHFTLVMT